MISKERTTQIIGILYQITIWTLFYIVFFHAYVEEHGIAKNYISTLASIFFYSLFIIFSLINTWYLIPFFFEKKRYVRYTFFVSLLLALIAFLIPIFHTYVFKLEPKDHFHAAFLFFMFFAFIIFGLGSFFHFFKRWNMFRENMLNNEKEKVEAQLKALKAQVNPHLLFNTLNNIYSMSLEKSDKAPGAILKLSDLMSYALYDCKKERVSLKNEIVFIESYIELEKNRFEENIKINYVCNVEDEYLEIAPLIFLPFVENAFKHSGAEKNEVPEVSISLNVNAEQHLIFECVNTFIDEPKEVYNPYSGIGIDNIKKQLAFLYPEKHILNITKSESHFSVYLKIFL